MHCVAKRFTHCCNTFCIHFAILVSCLFAFFYLSFNSIHVLHTHFWEWLHLQFHTGQKYIRFIIHGSFHFLWVFECVCMPSHIFWLYVGNELTISRTPLYKKNGSILKGLFSSWAREGKIERSNGIVCNCKCKIEISYMMKNCIEFQCWNIDSSLLDNKQRWYVNWNRFEWQLSRHRLI